MTSRTRGPKRPSPQPALPPARARVATLLDEVGPDALLADLVKDLGGHPNATRAHLEALVEDGLAEARPRPRSGPGRPALGWTLTDAGRRAIAGDPSATAYAEIVSAVAAHLAEIPESDRLARSIGRTWSSDRVTHPSRSALIEVLTDLGFDPEQGDEGIRLRSCPILDAATALPDPLCAMHAGLVRQRLADSGGYFSASLVPFAAQGRCTVRLRAVDADVDPGEP